ncbi:MAG: acetyltransferase, family protein [Acidimicrobiaceae bacterium]|nr:acetyltransferase, family protein [Acidimicrobiaceae bacterium]
MNADPVVMEHFLEALTRPQSDAMVDRIESHFSVLGYGHWAVEVLGGAPFIGFVGLELATFPAHFTPAVEVGWRLERAAWHQGYALEAARAALDYGFEVLGLEEVVSFTARVNTRSERVMSRLAMTHDPADDFDYDRLPVGHVLRPHVLYRARRATWSP